MFCPGLLDIKWEHLILAGAATLLLIGQMSHSRLAANPSELNWEDLQQMWSQGQAKSVPSSAPINLQGE
jgi:hypothetical protein